MKIAVDARELTGQRTGVGRYLAELLMAWARHGAAGTTFILYSSSPVDLTPFNGLDVRAVTLAGRGVRWEQFTLPAALRREPPDLLFAPGYTAPLLSKTPTVLVVHDVSFTSHPEWFGWREGARRRTITRLAAEHAARVITVSSFSKGEIETQLGIPASQITVIPNGVTRLASMPARTTALPPTVLYVGSIFNRRHIPELIAAVGLLVARGRDLRLDIVGENRTTPHLDLAARVRAAGLETRVELRAYVTDTELAACYARAGAFAFVSDYEGFGLTPLEALAAGVPTVVLDHPQTRDVYGDSAVYVASPTPSAIADGLEQVLFDPAVRASVLATAERTLARYSWDAAAARLMTVFRDVAATRAII